MENVISTSIFLDLPSERGLFKVMMLWGVMIPNNWDALTWDQDSAQVAFVSALSSHHCSCPIQLLSLSSSSSLSSRLEQPLFGECMIEYTTTFSCGRLILVASFSDVGFWLNSVLRICSRFVPFLYPCFPRKKRFHNNFFHVVVQSYRRFTTTEVSFSRTPYRRRIEKA
jgi:hypothetical protein